ncbi:MAG: hypothetical protein MUF54_00300 [Polyangiaceae bacterium]|nr:hypothetical protein [Polyangiaceae bacterium]
MTERHQCVDCRRLSPPTESGYTLISKEFGWRLTRSKGVDGSFRLEWRCPPCWQKHKVKQTTQPWEPSRRPPPRIVEQAVDEEQMLTQSGEHSRAIFDEEFTPPSTRRRPPPSERSGQSEEQPPISRPGSGLPRKR